MLRDHGDRASASCGVPVYTPAFTPVPVYTAWCEQFAYGYYPTAWWPGVKLITNES